MTGWSLRVLPGEVIGNVLGSWRRHLVMALLVAAIVGSLCAAEVDAAARAIDVTRDMQQHGSNVFIVSGPDASRGPVVSAAKCDALNSLPSVLAAGGLGSLPVASTAGAPGTPLRPYAATGRIGDVLDPSLSFTGYTHGGLVSTELAGQIGVRRGELVEISGGQLKLEFFDPSARHPLGPVLLLIPSAARLVDECWFEVEPAARDFGAAIGMAALSDGQAPLVVRTALASDEYTVDPLKDFTDRSTRFYWLVAGLALALPSAIGIWIGRGGMALYRSLGAGRGMVSCIFAGESFWVVLCGSGVGVAGSAVGMRNSAGFGGEAWGVGLRSVLLAAGVGLAVIVLAVSLLSRGSIVEQLRDR